MSDLEVKRETTVTLTLSEAYAEKTQDCLGQVLNALGQLPEAGKWYQGLVNIGAIDNLLALRTAINNALEKE
jgi:hypothetical protein